MNTTTTLQRTRKSITLFLISLSILAIAGCKKETKEEEDPAPVSVTPVGEMELLSNHGPFVFRTNGGGTIRIDLTVNPMITITHDDYSNFDLVFWGVTDITSSLAGTHENLSGKHIKDRFGVRRTIIFPDGAKITMISSGKYNPMLSISIYDGNQSHRINCSTNTLTHSSENQETAESMDNEEADGETSSFTIYETGLLLFTLYTEDIPGEFVEDYYLLGELFIDEPNTVHDYFDDPTLGHT